MLIVAVLLIAMLLVAMLLIAMLLIAMLIVAMLLVATLLVAMLLVATLIVAMRTVLHPQGRGLPQHLRLQQGRLQVLPSSTAHRKYLKKFILFKNSLFK